MCRQMFYFHLTYFVIEQGKKKKEKKEMGLSNMLNWI